MSNDFESGKGGSRSGKWQELLFELQRENPGISRANLFQLFRDEVVNDPEMTEAVIEYAFINYGEEAKFAEKLKERVKGPALLDLIMLSGKKMGDGTGYESAGFVDALERIGRIVTDADQTHSETLSRELNGADRKLYDFTQGPHGLAWRLQRAAESV